MRPSPAAVPVPKPQAAKVKRSKAALSVPVDFDAVAEALRAAGLKPWLVDVDPFSGMFDPAHLRERLPEAPGPLEAILPGGSHGRAPDLRAWAAFRDETGLPILVEAIEAFDVIQSAPVPVIVGLPSGQGVFVACEDATPVAAMEGPQFEGQAGLDLWPIKRPRLATAAQRLRVLLLDAPVGFPPGWGVSWVSEACALSVPDGTATVVLERLATAGVPAKGVDARTPDLAADETPIADRLAGSTVVLRVDPDLDLSGLDDLAAAVREAVTT